MSPPIKIFCNFHGHKIQSENITEHLHTELMLKHIITQSSEYFAVRLQLDTMALYKINTYSGFVFFLYPLT